MLPIATILLVFWLTKTIDLVADGASWEKREERRRKGTRKKKIERRKMPV